MSRQPRQNVSEFEAQVAHIMEARYPDYTTHLQGLYDFNAHFTGSFRGQSGRWIVECTSHNALRGSAAIAKLGNMARTYGDGEFDGLLVVTTDTVPEKPRLVRRLRDNVPGKFIEVRTLEELQHRSGFDDYPDEYPGAVAKIGHNSAQYLDALEAVGEVIYQLGTSNSVGLTADIRKRLLVEVQVGKTLLEQPTVRIAALANSIIPALKWIALACAAGPLGDLATKAFWAIEKLVFG